MYMYVYKTDTSEIVALCNGEKIADCENIARDCGYEREGLSWSFSDNGLWYPVDTAMTSLFMFNKFKFKFK